MIVPMKKVSLLVLDKNKDDALTRIRDLGVIHLERKTVSSPALTRLLNRRTQIDTAAGILESFSPGKSAKIEPPKLKQDLAAYVVSLSERRKKLQDYIFNHQREMGRFEKWGDFNPRDFTYLASKGINACLYELPLASYAKEAGDVPFIVLSTDKKNHAARLLTFDKIPGKEPHPLPERPLVVVEERNVFRKFEMSKIEEELASLSPLRKQLDAEKKSNLAEIEFETARAGMEQIEQTEQIEEEVSAAISWISGYVPAMDLGALKRAASENGWAFCADDPAEDDTEVPTKLKNSRFTSFIYPLTNFLEIVPGYRETDISFWFLLFFTLFFGMIFGDAAYGSILLLVSIFFIAKSAGKETPLIFKFLLLMSVSNLLWGVLTCAWFGLDTALVPQFLQNLSLPLIVNVSSEPFWLSAYNANNFWIQAGLVAPVPSVEIMEKAVTTHLMIFCFTIALVQLSIAHINGIMKNIRSPRMLAELGQLGMLVGMYFVVLSLVVLNTGFEGVETWQLCSLAGGFALNFIFGNYEGSVVKSLVTSCVNILPNVLGIANVFSDIMSYIRLWAVGLAGASIAATVNGFAGPMMGHFIFFVFGVGLFIFGHSFNMVLNVLSVLVHGVRLNTLEFSSHLGLTWSGFAYKPFAKR